MSNSLVTRYDGAAATSNETGPTGPSLPNVGAPGRLAFALASIVASASASEWPWFESTSSIPSLLRSVAPARDSSSPSNWSMYAARAAVRSRSATLGYGSPAETSACRSAAMSSASDAAGVADVTRAPRVVVTERFRVRSRSVAAARYAVSAASSGGVPKTTVGDSSSRPVAAAVATASGPPRLSTTERTC